MFLVRARGRERDLAVRAALGASRSRIAGRLLIESATYGLLGGGAGILIAYWGVGVLGALRPSDLPLLDNVAVDGVVLAFKPRARLCEARVRLDRERLLGGEHLEEKGQPSVEATRHLSSQRGGNRKLLLVRFR